MTLGELIDQAMQARGWNADQLAREISMAAISSGHPGHTVTGQSVRGWIKRGAIPEKVRLMLLIDVLDLPRDQLTLDVGEVRDYRSGPTTEYPVLTPDAERVAALEKKVADLELTLRKLTEAQQRGRAHAQPSTPAR